MQQPHPRLAEQQLRLLAEQIPAIVWTADRKHRFTSVSGAGLEKLGVQGGSPDALRMVDALGAPLPPLGFEAAHDRALKGEPSSYSATWQGRIFECQVEPLQTENEIEGSIGVAVDVTERRRAERDALFAYEEAVQCIVRAIEERDIVTGSHVERMSDYCALIAEELGLPLEERQAIALASRLHDIGKVAVPDGILLKESRLTSEERLIMQRHCIVGHDILAVSSSRILQLAAVIARTHHEWFDGSGYPTGVAGEAIPLPGRIAAIADSYDALTSDRPYRPALSPQNARDVMLEERGTHFDPHLLKLFLGSDALPKLEQRPPPA